MSKLTITKIECRVCGRTITSPVVISAMNDLRAHCPGCAEGNEMDQFYFFNDGTKMHLTAPTQDDDPERVVSKIEQMRFDNNGWECVAECGNLPEWDGFEPCTREGVVVDLEGDYRYVKCGKCGRIADTTTFEVVGRA